MIQQAEDKQCERDQRTDAASCAINTKLQEDYESDHRGITDRKVGGWSGAVPVVLVNPNLV